MTQAPAPRPQPQGTTPLILHLKNGNHSAFFITRLVPLKSQSNKPVGFHHIKAAGFLKASSHKAEDGHK